MIRIPIPEALRSLPARVRSLLRPSDPAWRGAGNGILLVSAILILSAVLPYLGVLGVPVLLLRALYYAGLAALMALGVFLAIGLLGKFPLRYRKILVAGIFFLLQFFTFTTRGKLLVISWVLLASSLFFGALWVMARDRLKEKPRGKVVMVFTSLFIGLAGLVVGGYWYFSPGKSLEPPPIAAMQTDSLPALIDAGDPALSGPYEVLSLSYGSGTDKHRPEYGKEAGLITGTVDGSPFVGNWKKFHGWARTKYWGFDEKALPLNARVWYPAGEGPFPLVLIVHGNHLDRDYSDPGYAYLGELMASRGFIFASVDENFLNGTWSNVFNSLKEENDARGWLLLKHLQCWRSWNGEAGNPFFGKVDLDRISLIGHSRGGEAVSIAACFNRLPYYPDDATVHFDFGFHIRSVIPIAPVDGQYKPAGVGTPVENTSYFTLQGSHDMDMRSFHGARQFERVRFTDSLYHVKAGVWVYGANHGQFNTSWGGNDVGYPGIYWFNRKNIMPVDQQEQIARVFIAAFLELTLHDRKEYLPLFMDYRCGRDWLPGTLYLNQFADSRTEYFCDYEEDLDLSTASRPGIRILGSHLSIWREKLVPLKWGSYETRAVYLGWNRENGDSLPGCYRLEWEASLAAGPGDCLVFSLADAGENSNPERSWLRTDSVSNTLDQGGDRPRETKKGKAEKEEKEKEPIDLSLVLTDSLGQEARLTLGSVHLLQPIPEPRVMKIGMMSDVPVSEILFGYYSVPFPDFTRQNPAFNPAAIRSVAFVFDRSPEGVVVLDALGIRKD